MQIKNHTRIYKVLRIHEVALQPLGEVQGKPQVQCMNEIRTCWKQSEREQQEQVKMYAVRPMRKN